MIKPENRCAVSQGRVDIAMLLLCAILVSACGLGMNADDKLARAARALQSGDYRAAIVDAKNVLLDEPENVQARLLLGRGALAEGDGATAEKELRRAVELGTPLTDIAVELAGSMLQQQKFAAVIEEFDPGLLSAEPERSNFLVVIGDARLALGQPELAREMYSLALASDPQGAVAQLGVVHSHIAEQNLVQARDSLLQVLAMNPGYVPAWLTSGRLHMAQQDFEVARNDFMRALHLAEQGDNLSQQVQSVLGLGEACLAMNDIAAAREHSATLEKIAPGTIAALQMAARIAYASSDWTVAQDKLTDILRRAPEDNMARVLLGAVHLRNGNVGQADMYLSAAVAKEPNNADARRLLAEARLQLNRGTEAQEVLQPLIDMPNADPWSLAMAARADLVAGDFEGATEYLERIAAENSANAEAQLDLAAAYLMAGRIDDAQELLDLVHDDASDDSEFRRDVLSALMLSRSAGIDAALVEGAALRDRWPDRTMSHVIYGAMLASTGDMRGARSAFEAAVHIDPNDINAMRYLAQVDGFEGKLPAATGRYQNILRKNNKDVAAMIALAQLAERDGNTREAIEWLEKARAVDRTIIAPRIVLSKMYITARKFDEAETVALEGLAISDGVADLHNSLGVVRLNKQHAATALQSFERAGHLDPENRDYRLNLARAYAAGGDTGRAITVIEEGEGDPLQHLATGVVLASVQLSARKPEAALAIARKLRDIHRDSGVPFALEAELLAHSGDLGGAIAAYDEALGLEPTKLVAIRAYYWRLQAKDAAADKPLSLYLELHRLDGDVRMLLAQYYQQHSVEGRAIDEYNRVLEIDPDHVAALNNLAWLYMTNEDPRAEKTARRAYALAPQNAAVIDTLGWILAQNHEVDEAAALLRDAAALSDHDEIRYHLAATLAASGKGHEARQILESILQAGGEFPSRDEARSLLVSL